MNNIAQTRMAASYGLFQISYSTAVEKEHYPVDNAHFPERLNESPIGPIYAVPYLFAKLATILKEEGSADNDWPLGFERTFSRAFSYYNGNESYGSNIVNVLAPKYLPSSSGTNQ